MNDQNNEYTDWDHETAKQIACAIISYQAGVSYESLWAQYAEQEEDPGTFAPETEMSRSRSKG